MARLRCDALRLCIAGFQSLKYMWSKSKDLSFMKYQKPKCWILKTTGGGFLKNDQWDKFIAENVVAVGWRHLMVNPRKYRSKDEYKAYLKTKYPSDNSHAANITYNFSHIPPHDLIIIARGYKPFQKKPVRIYGIAEAGTFKIDEKSDWWKFKRKTHIFPLRDDFVIPQPEMVKIFKRKSLLQTLHGPFPFSNFDRFCKAIKCIYKLSSKGLICKPSNEPSPHSKRSFFLDELDTEPLSEGTRKNIAIDRYERNPVARNECLKHYGFHCQVCGNLLSDIYGITGEEVIQVHHLKPVYKSKGKRIINPISDLKPVCPNCHVIIHTHKPPLSIRKVKSIINENKK